jgi:hypothetical protein
MMALRVVSRLFLLLAGLVLATALVVGAMSVLASAASDRAAPFLDRDPVAAVKEAVEAPRHDVQASDTSSTRAVVLVFAGVVLLAALPAHRVYLYRSGYRSDWH